MVGKKGLIRILEATIAIIIVISFLAVTQIKNVPVSSEDYDKKAYNIIEEISRNTTLREIVVSSDDGFVVGGKLYDFVDARIPEYYLDFRIKVCGEIDMICGLDRYVRDSVYSAERVIVSGIREPEFENKKIKIFIWKNDG